MATKINRMTYIVYFVSPGGSVHVDDPIHGVYDNYEDALNAAKEQERYVRLATSDAKDLGENTLALDTIDESSGYAAIVAFPDLHVCVKLFPMVLTEKGKQYETE